MYQWYKESTVCYVYLKDTDTLEQILEDEWFDRGWTLQELVALTRVEFYNKYWKHLGSKTDLKQQNHERTGISLALLENTARLQDFSIAERLFWAANRVTTEVEDRAYSLFGVFDVNLPMLYGEVEKAFLRLQEEIVKTSNDHSIFSWGGLDGHHARLLAGAPEDFTDRGSVKSVRIRKGSSAYRMTNRGIEITLDLTPWALDKYLTRIRCCDLASEGYDPLHKDYTIGVFLKRLDEDGQYARIEVDGVDLMNNVPPPPKWDSILWEDISKEVPIYVCQANTEQAGSDIAGVYGYRLGDGLIRYDSKRTPLFTFYSPKGVRRDASTRMVTIPHGGSSKGWVSTLSTGLVQSDEEIRLLSA
jgi:hypothetical protein